MPHILKNNSIEIHIDLPNENYNFTRFDWTGKIIDVKFKGVSFVSNELNESKSNNHFGTGFYNEFGMEAPIGFHEIEKKEWFPKIGIGAIKKQEDSYDFMKLHEMKLAIFKETKKEKSLLTRCIPDPVNGFDYLLEKEITLTEDGFQINYYLENKGEKVITTNEYCHNFISINKELIGKDYVLKFPFEIIPENLDQIINPDKFVKIKNTEITFLDTPTQPFFYKNLSGRNEVNAFWELRNLKTKMAISETGSFKTNAINLWGIGHVISPELFIDISLKPFESQQWSRTYRVFETN